MRTRTLSTDAAIADSPPLMARTIEWLCLEIERKAVAVVARSPARPRTHSRGRMLHHVLERCAHVLRVLERAVDGRKPDVRNLVELAQPLHRHLTDEPARHLQLVLVTQLVLDVVDHHLQARRRDVALLGADEQAAKQLLPVELLAPAILLDNVEHGCIDTLIRGEPLGAAQALAAAANRLTRFRVARIDDFRISCAAEGTSHACRSFPVDLSGTHTH